LLSCSMADYKAMLAQQEAVSAERKKPMQATKDEFEMVEISDSPALSTKDLQKALKADTVDR